jgi:hypothetical protein
LCSIFFDRKEALAEREIRRSFSPGLEKEGKIKRKFKFEHTSYHQTDRHIIIALDCNNRREREESAFERVVF